MKRIKAIIFDLDGTLLNTLEDLSDSMNHVLKEYGFPERHLEEIRQFVGNGVRKLVERAVFSPNKPEERDQELIDRMFVSMKEYYECHCDNKTAPYDGICEMLSKLSNAGLKLAIVSNKVDPAVKELTERYFGDLITAAVGDQPGCKVKPSSDLINLALSQMNVKAENCIYVGDSEVDIATANHAGMPCISVTWGFRDREFLEEMGGKVFVDTAEQLAARILERSICPDDCR